MLHNDRELFEQLILKTSEALGIKAEIIEKDYYFTRNFVGFPLGKSYFYVLL